MHPGIALIFTSFCLSTAAWRSSAFRMSTTTFGKLKRPHLLAATAIASIRTVHSGAVEDNNPLRIKAAPAHDAFNLVDDTFVREYGVRALIYSHKKTGAQLLSVLAPDDNKVFGITFRTPPKDSTGVAHILEHSVLCGSRKYPVKEPFAYLLKGSLHTFLNAFTYPDRTCYPIASQNTKDFYNLINVYMDAVLHPRAMWDPQVLEQEGWHYEVDEETGQLAYKGVVYNEMKGVYSSPEALRERAVQEALFPDNAYGVDSGGDPLVIPNLTFKDFQAFHMKYYHPGNSRIYFYGDDDPLKRLELMDDYLKEFEKPDQSPSSSAVAWQPKLNLSQKIVKPFPAAPGNSPKHMLTVNWVLNHEKLSAYEELCLGVLDHVMLATPSSALRKVLIDSGLGDSVTGGLSPGLLQHTFGVGLKGVGPENTTKVESLVVESLQKFAAEGFAADAIEASINSIEFDLREFNTGSYPRGLSFMLGCLSKWIYDGHPVDAVRFEEPLAQLKANIQQGKPVFQDLLQNYFLTNQHRVTMEMVPDTQMEQQIVDEEESRLKQIRDKMNETEFETVVTKAKALQAAQEAEDSPENRATVPMLSLADIDRKTKTIIREEDEHHGVKLLIHEQPTNGILYTDVVFDMAALTFEDLQYLPIFNRLFMESGTSTMDDVTLSRTIGAHTGGIGSSYSTLLKHTPGKVSDLDDVTFKFMVRGKAVVGKVDHLFNIMRDLLLDAKLDNRKRTLEVLRETKIRFESAFSSSGNSFAATRLGAQFSLAGYVSEMTGGVSYYQQLSRLIEEADQNWPTFLARLERIRTALVSRDRMLINLTADRNTLAASRTHLEGFVDSIPIKPASTNFLQQWSSRSRFAPKNEGLIVPTQVNYVVKAGQLLAPGEVVSGSSSVVSRFLSRGFLWDNVRVIGGAYGGSCSFGAASGRFVFSSYRDPNLAKTLSLYDAAAEHLKNTPISSDDLEQAIVGTIGDLDLPLFPDQKGYESLVRYLTGRTDEDRQRWRDEVLSTNDKDFREFADKLASLTNSARTCVVGSKLALEEANQQLDKNQVMELVSVLESSASDNVDTCSTDA